MIVHQLKANELRIGNWISYRGEKDLVVSSIPSIHGSVQTERYSNFGDNHYIGSDDLRDYEPIQITENWLVGFGFKKMRLESFYEINIINDYTSIVVNCNNRLLEVMHCGVSVIILSGNTYKGYVHQLQNIYYTLTGEELNNGK